MNATTETKGKAIATQQPRSVLIDMSARYGMEPAAFEATVRATCMPADKNGRVPTREEFAAFLLVAREYKLNPITKEIYAFSGKGGGVVPIVSIDGWANLINSHGQLDGMTFEMHHDEEGNLVACTCRIYRKDRAHPVEITEYLSECIRNTEPWKMKHRMLRHKSLIQCARYAFGFAGIYDEDEGAVIAERIQAPAKTPPKPTDKTPPKPADQGKVDDGSAKLQASTSDREAAKADKANQADFTDNIVDADAEEIVDQETGEVTQEEQRAAEAGHELSPNEILQAMDDEMKDAKDEATVEEVWGNYDLMAKFEKLPDGEINQAIARKIRAKHLRRVLE